MGDQLEEELVEIAPEMPTEDCTYYQTVVRKSASTMKVRMGFDASVKAHLLAYSVNECMHTGSPLQPLLWDIFTRARMPTHLVLAHI